MSVSPASAKGRLLRRAQLIARVHHPNLVRLVALPGGAGLTPVLNDARPLSEYGRSGAPFRRFELQHAVQVLLDVLNGLRALHELALDGAGFVHGAVSPQSICIEPNGSARLIPLTTLHLLSDSAIEMTGYVAPECLRGEAVDVRADLFSVGVLLWEAIARRRLFPDGSSAAVLSALESGAVSRVSPPDDARWASVLCAVAKRALAKEPALRFSSAAELSQAIVRAGGPHLRRGYDWQDEAPTLQGKRRVAEAVVRSATPPATTVDVVVDVVAAPPSAAVLPARATTPSLDIQVDVVPDDVAEAPISSVASTPAKARRSGLRLFLLGAGVATLLNVVWWFAPHRQFFRSAGSGQPVPLATLATRSAPSVAPPPTSASAPPAALAPPASAPATSRVSPAVLPPSRLERPPAPRKPPPRPRTDADYGI